SMLQSMKLLRPASAGLVLALALPATAADRINDLDSVSETWGPQTRALLGNRVFYTDGSNIFLHDGANLTVQDGSQGAVDGNSLSFGPGNDADTMVAGWVRADAGWVWNYKAAAPVTAPLKIAVDNPQNPGAPMT